MPDNQGWISIHRKLQFHWLFDDAEKLRAWIVILLEVNHKPGTVNIKNELFKCGRGESLKSLDTWAKLFKWNKSKTRRFLKLLESDSMIVLKSERKTTRLTVLNYDSYQDQRNADETQTKRKRNADETQMTPNNNDNNNNNDNKESSAKSSHEEKNKLFDYLSVCENTLTEHQKIAVSFYKMLRAHRERSNISTAQMDKRRFDKWVEDSRLMIEQDKRSIDEIRTLFNYLKNGDGFWETTIQSISGLRKNADQILMKAKNKANGKNKQYHSEDKFKKISESIEKHFPS